MTCVSFSLTLFRSFCCQLISRELQQVPHGMRRNLMLENAFEFSMFVPLVFILKY